MLAMFGAAIALGILFSSKTFTLQPETRLRLSILATVTIGFFAEFRNEGKFYFKNLGHRTAHRKRRARRRPTLRELRACDSGKSS